MSRRRKSIDETLLPPSTPRKAPKPERMPSFSECFDTYFKDWFSGDSWGIWRIVAKAIFGERLTKRELETFTKHTGRTIAQSTPAREVWLICGRRAGKDYFCAALLTYLACIRTYTFKPGEKGRVMLLAVDSDQADVLYEYLNELIGGIPEFESMVAKRSTKFGLRRLDLNNRIQILIKPADKRRVRGRTVLACVADEIAHWWSEEKHANPDVEVLKALRPSMLGVPGALLLCVSSPFRRQGAVFAADQKHWGKNGDRVLFWRAATWEMRPDTPGHRAQYPTFAEELEEEKANDPASFEAEYGAQYRLDLEDYLSLDAVMACVIKGRDLLPYEAGGKYSLFLDTAGGGGQDSLAACITRTIATGAQVCRLFERKPPFDAEAVADEVADLAAEYGLTVLKGDNFSGATWSSMLLKRGLTHQPDTRSATVLYRNFAPIVTGKRIELLDPETGVVQARAVNQLVNLQKRDGGEKIVHPQGQHDDVANAMAGAGCLAIRPLGGFAVSVTSVSTTGEVHVTGEPIRERPAPMVGSTVHPHERVDYAAPEAEARMGAAKAASWRKAWSQMG